MNFNETGTVITVLGAITSAYAVHNDKALHQEAVKIEKELHQREVEHAADLATSELRAAKRLCIAERNTELKQHFQQLNADLINGNREAERDMYEQRNSQFQTIIVASTVMFGALCTVIIEGQLPQELTETYGILIMATSGASFAFLFVCMVLCVQIILLSSKFMYIRASGHNKIVQELVVDSFNTLNKMNDHLKDMKDDALDTEQMWMEHVERVDQYMKERQRFNERLLGEAEEDASDHDLSLARWMSSDVSGGGARVTEALLQRPSGAGPGAQTNSFEWFWDKHCKTHAWLALQLFYLGTVALLVSVALLVFASMQHTFNNARAGMVFMVFILVSVLLTFWIVYTSAYRTKLRDARASMYWKAHPV
jgi:hypothetical protein